MNHVKSFSTRGIVLARTNYAEADRILTFLTPDNGKVKAIAKGVRKPKSKLAGGVEIFSVSELSFIVGRSEINTLISSRLVKHYGNIVKNLERTALTYELIKITNKATEDNPEEAYFNLLEQSFEALNDDSIAPELINVWFSAQLLRQAGHTPNLRTQKSGPKLQAGKTYDFNLDDMSFQGATAGYSSDQIKFLRLIFSDNHLHALQKIQNAQILAGQTLLIVRSMLQNHVRI